jgi:hypothetical protein
VRPLVGTEKLQNFQEVVWRTGRTAGRRTKITLTIRKSMVKKLTNWKPFGKRPVGRPKNRWIDGILKDMEVLKVKNWKELTRNRKEWNKLVEKAKTHPEF